MINPITPKRKPAATTDRGRLDFVFSTTTPSHSKKDEDDAFIREPRAEHNLSL